MPQQVHVPSKVQLEKFVFIDPKLVSRISTAAALNEIVARRCHSAGVWRFGPVDFQLSRTAVFFINDDRNNLPDQIPYNQGLPIN